MGRPSDEVMVAPRWRGSRHPLCCSFKAWTLAFETGLGVTVFLGMLALWLSALDGVEEIAASLKATQRTGKAQLGHGICSNRSNYPAPWELRSDQLTILVNGFIEARLPLLQRTLKTYSTSPAVHSIIVLWSNTSTPSTILSHFETLGAPISIIRQATTSLNDRFLPRQSIKTKAVVICDDDITVELPHLEFALQVWRENQNRIVGFFPRAHSFSFDSHSWIYIKNSHKYSIMLTKIMILATEYLWKYSCEMPVGVKEYVDRGMNCEDIAMNFLVSDSSGEGPLLVEGEPRDWGDSRNSGAQELTSMGLSARADHRKDRGDCIREFHRLWNGVPLRFSYSKAVRDLDEQVKCEKFGHLIDCDLSATTLRDARRHAGAHITKRTSQYAYVTLLQSRTSFHAALVWAQAIRNSGSIHDLVLLHTPGTANNAILLQHFDVIKEVKKGLPFPRLSAWQLREYERVVFMDLNLLCLTNLDFLFGLREPAAAPLTMRPMEFHTGLMLLRPSDETFGELVKWAGGFRDLHRLLNGFFREWFDMDVEHRLPLRLNMPLHLIPGSASSNRNGSEDALPGVLQYPKRELLSLQRSENQTVHSRPFSKWLEILGALRSNKYQPLNDSLIANLSWKPSNSSWPPKLPRSKAPLKPKLHRATSAFATVLTSADDVAAVGGWIATFSKLHIATSSILIAKSSLDWKPFESLFDSVVVVDDNNPLIQLWNQTRYDRLVYVNPRSIFLSNCEFLLENHEPFAAAPDFVLPDTFSPQVMVIQPDYQTFLELSRQSTLNEYQWSDCWYSGSVKHRIEPFFNPEGSEVVVNPEWKVFCFYNSSDPLRSEVWKKHVCSLRSRSVELLKLCSSSNL